MKIAYIDGCSGISGDMFLAALVDAGFSLSMLAREMKKIDLFDYTVDIQKVVKKGVRATYVEVATPVKQKIRHYSSIKKLILDSKLSENVKKDCLAVIRRIGEVESHIHGIPLEKVHFHEIGALDTIVDVVGVACGIHHLKISKLYSSKLNVGCGTVSFSHGTVPVPAHATVELLKGVPVYSDGTKGELVTPTGAALITHFCDEFGVIPDMKIKRVGYGAGSMDLDRPNVLRLSIGEETSFHEQDYVCVVEATIDDMQPEFHGFVIERLLELGALDVSVMSVRMKKNRLGVLVQVLCEMCDEDTMKDGLFNETTTIGVRSYFVKRSKLTRTKKSVSTKYGEIGVKVCFVGNSVRNSAPEFEDCARAARKHKVSLKDVYGEVLKQL